MQRLRERAFVVYGTLADYNTYVYVTLYNNVWNCNKSQFVNITTAATKTQHRDKSSYIQHGSSSESVDLHQLDVCASGIQRTSLALLPRPILSGQPTHVHNSDMTQGMDRKRRQLLLLTARGFMAPRDGRPSIDPGGVRK